MCVCVSVSGPLGGGGVDNYRIQSYGVKGGGWMDGKAAFSFRCLIENRIGRYV